MCWAAKILPRDLSTSNSEGGQIQGIIGAVISQSSSTVFFFWAAKCFAILTAVTVLPQPGLPQTARMPPLDSSIGSSSSGSVLRRKRLPFRKFIRRPHFLRKDPPPRFL